MTSFVHAALFVLRPAVFIVLFEPTSEIEPSQSLRTIRIERQKDPAMGIVDFKNPNFTFHRSLAHRVIPLSKFAKLSSNAGKLLVVGAAIVRPKEAPAGAAQLSETNQGQEGQPQILLVQRASNEEAYPNQWELPGGHAELGTDQTILEAVVREVREETGLQVESIRKEFMGFEYETSKGHSKQLNFVVTVRWEPGLEIKLNPEEHQAFRWVRTGEWEMLEMTEAMRTTVSRALDTVAQLPNLL